VAEANLWAVTAAAQLGLSRPRINRLADLYNDDGPSELLLTRREMRHKQLPALALDLAPTIIRDRYPDFDQTLTCEKLMRASIKVDMSGAGQTLFDVNDRIYANFGQPYYP
jgi:hypothetical protein